MMCDFQPKVSIIIPVYNAIRYLEESLNSVCTQSYHNLEIILLDDGSTDGSGELCDSIALMDKRVQVFHLENGGVSQARNFGLERLTGDYVAFVDADDLVKPDYIAAMVEAAAESGAQLAVCRYMSGPEYSPEQFCQHKTAAPPPHVHVDLSRYTWTGKYSHTIAWAALYSAPLAKSLSFSRDLFVGEDTLFFAQALKKAGSFIWVDEEYYYYRYSENSIVHSKYQLKHATEVTSWERISELFKDQPAAFKNECETAIAFRCKKNYIKATMADYPNDGLYEQLHKKTRERSWYILCSPELNLKAKLHFAAFILMPDAYMRYVRWRRRTKENQAE